MCCIEGGMCQTGTECQGIACLLQPATCRYCCPPAATLATLLVAWC